ncbi:flagellar assembly peptidoglycan hydrolase FlgJ [Ralstonia insidiosa]|uniref:Flagellar assembly peptidoglycan hydrolase FlgJ n=2 Tax=Ralstonia insidiosa TaxID=190721 RepID=A0A848NUV3_9RALS|nr:flagellar assembly peptidoglycan hydrolase FlgJ [Ralstonia insidiosa]
MVARPPAPAAPASAPAAGFGSLYKSLSRDISGTVRNGFERTFAPQLSSQATQWVNAMQARAEAAQRPVPSGAGVTVFGSVDPDRQAFLAEIMPHARRAGAMIGAAPELIAAHAALESGWGSKPLTNARGETTHNLFGIKATGNWKGASSASATTEYVDGEAVKTVDRFRAYPSYASAFRDYGTLLRDSPRYAGVHNVGDDARAFARALKRGGYATDPAYESKLVQMAGQVKGMVR